MVLAADCGADGGGRRDVALRRAATSDAGPPARAVSRAIRAAGDGAREAGSAAGGERSIGASARSRHARPDRRSRPGLAGTGAAGVHAASSGRPAAPPSVSTAAPPARSPAPPTPATLKPEDDTMTSQAARPTLTVKISANVRCPARPGPPSCGWRMPVRGSLYSVVPTDGFRSDRWDRTSPLAGSGPRSPPRIDQRSPATLSNVRFQPDGTQHGAALPSALSCHIAGYRVSA